MTILSQTVGLVACAGPLYTSYLLRTLPDWAKALYRVVVVVPANEYQTAVREAGWPDNVYLLPTPKFGDRLGVFNKGAGLNDGYEFIRINHSGWVLQFDADVCFPQEDLPAPGYFQETKLYGAKRVREDGNPEPKDRDQGVYGFFMLFYSGLLMVDRPFPEQFPHAGGYDFEFRNRWAKENQEILPAKVKHVGIAYRNWYGTSDTPATQQVIDRKMKKLTANGYKTPASEKLK